jgi:YD repeat-containing protein
VDPSGTKLVPKLITDARFSGPMAAIQYAYQSVSSEGSPANGEIASESDSAGNLLTQIADIANPGHNAAIGRKETTGDGKTRSFYYNANGQLIQDLDYGGNSTTYNWDNSTGYLDSVTDANKKTITYSRLLPLGKIIKITYPDGSMVSRTYTSTAFPYYIASKTDELGHTTTYTRDSSNRVTQINYPDGGTESFTYNSFGEVLTRQTAVGGIYQMAGLLCQRNGPDSSSQHSGHP